MCRVESLPTKLRYRIATSIDLNSRVEALHSLSYASAHYNHRLSPSRPSHHLGSAGEPVSDRLDLGFVQAFVGSSLLELAIFLPFLLLTALALWRSSVRERGVIREELAGEVGGAVSAGEYAEIVADRVLRTRRIDPLRPRASAALVYAQDELAFRKRRVRHEGRDPERDSLAVA
jgi:hypothetical protein